MSTEQEHDNPFNVIFYTDRDISEIVFSDEELTLQWEKVFIYLFDESGSCLLYAYRGAVPDVGYCFESVNSTATMKVRQRALSIAGLLDRSLMLQLLKSEERLGDDEDVSLILELGGPIWR